VEPTIETFRKIGKILVRPSLFMKRVCKLDSSNSWLSVRRNQATKSRKLKGI